jgi:Protein of unknown function (DUF1761)
MVLGPNNAEKEPAMQFVGINHLAVVAAAAAGWILGVPWYGLSARGRGRWPFIIAAIADLVVAEILGGLMGHVGSDEFTLFHGALTGAFCWVGFVIMPMLVGNRYAGRAVRPVVIDGGYWLVTLLVMGGILGGMGLS